MIREGAEKAARQLKDEPKSFGYPKLTPPYTRAARFRTMNDQPPHEARDEHASSLIALMNMPFTQV